METWVFWVPAGFITLAVLATVVLGLVRGARVMQAEAGARRAVRVYADQLREIDREIGRGLLDAAEAERLRLETARRLLEADRAQAGRAAGESPAAARALALAMVLVAAVVAGALYAWRGAPFYTDRPLAARHAEAAQARASRPPQAELEAQWLAAPEREVPPEPDAEFAALMERLREAVAQRPDDLTGHRLLAQNEARLGRFAQAAAAQARVVALLPPDAPEPLRVAELTRQAQFMIAAAGGLVSPEADLVLESILRRDPRNGFARFFLGLMFDQTGRPDLTFHLWRRLLEDSTPDAPWVPDLRASLETLAAVAGVRYQLPPATATGQRGPSADDIAAAEDMGAEDRAAMIGGMVEGLAARLASQGGPPEDWARLIRALAVLGQDERARAIRTEARLVFAGDAAAVALIDAALPD
jgi:cytochrome c-type biogenesis protein CcmH